MPFGPTHDIIKTLAFWGLDSFFQSIVVSNPEHVPSSSPIIIGSNHWNMSVDPALLTTRMPHGRRLHYWAKSTLFKNPIVKFILLDAGNIPVDRVTKNNQLLFKGTFDVVKLDECVALFPEGTSYTEPRVIQVKEGIAWAALEYAKNIRLTGQTLSDSPETTGGLKTAPGEVQDVKVIICGINYTNKTQFRSSVQILYSPPFILDQPSIEKFMTSGEEKLVVKELSKKIEFRLKQVTVNSPDWETLWCVWIVREFIWRDGLGPLHRYRDNMQQLVDLLSPKDDASLTLKDLRTNLIEYHNLLKAANSSHLIFSRSFPARESQARLLIELGRCLLFWPFFIVPAMFHIPVYGGAYLGSLLQPTEPESMAQNKLTLGLFTGLAFVPLYVILITSILLRYEVEVNWKMRLVGMIISLGFVIVIHKVHDGLIDVNYESWKRLRLTWSLKSDQLKNLWDIREKSCQGWELLCGQLKESKHPIIDILNLNDPDKVVAQFDQLDQKTLMNDRSD